jgi:hypothetical protein
VDVALVYQCGIANVFILDTYQRPESPEGRMARRVLQHAYSPCEFFARGMATAGARVRSYHCDEAGDIADRPWVKGCGDLWKESKRPVRTDPARKASVLSAPYPSY